MNIEVLVAAMNQSDHSLVNRMNISSDAIIGNQCDKNSVESYEIDGKQISYYNFAERGVGLNRNNTLMRATGDILVFADDDECFFDNYEEIIKEAYSKIPKADAIIFNIETIGADVGRRNITKIFKLNIFNSLNYGAVRLTVKNSCVKRANVNFHRQFGGGTTFSSGEDTLFIADLIKKGLRIYTYPATIASVNQETSTWFNGYNEKYFYDRGSLFKALSPKAAKLLCWLLLLKNKKRFFGENISFRQGWNLAKSGMKGFVNGISYDEWRKKAEKN